MASSVGDIPAIAGDGIAYSVAYLQFLDSSLEVWHFVKGILLGNYFFQECKVLLTKIFAFAVWCYSVQNNSTGWHQHLNQSGS
jgi:hypothetical protein